MENHKYKVENTANIKGNAYTKMFERLNLQSIGYLFKESSRLSNIDATSFSEREQIAEAELETGLQQLGEETAKALLPLIINYTSKKEEIQFSLGMKAGAKLALLLTSDFEHDF